MVRFEGTLQAGRGGGAFVELPAEVLTGLGGGTRFRVRGTIDGAGFASSAMAMGAGRVCVGVHKATRAAIGASLGDSLRLEVERDDRPRELVVPAELKEALGRDAEAGTTFEQLSATHRREYAEWIANAKRPETRRRRVGQALEMLRAGTKHP